MRNIKLWKPVGLQSRNTGKIILQPPTKQLHINFINLSHFNTFIDLHIWNVVFFCTYMQFWLEFWWLAVNLQERQFQVDVFLHVKDTIHHISGSLGSWFMVHDTQFPSSLIFDLFFSFTLSRICLNIQKLK